MSWGLSFSHSHKKYWQWCHGPCTWRMKNLLQHILIPPFCHFGGNQREILGRKNQRRASIFWWAFPWDCLLRSSIQEMFFIYWVLITMVSEHNKALSPLIHLRFWEFLDFGELHGADRKEPIVLGSGVGGMYLPFPKQRKRAGKVAIVILTKKNPAAPPQEGTWGRGQPQVPVPMGWGARGQLPAAKTPSALFSQRQVKAGLFSSCCHPGERNRIFGSAETIHSAKSSEFSSRTFLSSKDCQSSRNQIVVSLRTAICSASFQLPCSKSKNG